MSPTANRRPIGIFDSGLGGLTVARAVRDRLPGEALLYFGDTARVPYGTRSAKTVVRYARRCASLLRARHPKLLVVACNTVSAVALDVLRVELDIPVLGVIRPGAQAGLTASRSRRIGVVATRGTVASGAYQRHILSLDTRAEVFATAAPLLVPLAEEGWTTGPVPESVSTAYLTPLAKSGIDVLILGCTHYPLLLAPLKAAAQSCCSPHITVIDSAAAVANDLVRLIDERSLRNPDRHGSLQILVSDQPEHFGRVASRFLGEPLDAVPVEQIDL